MSRELAIYSNPGDLKKFLDTGKGVIAAALPKHMNPDRMLRLALTAFSTTPALRKCTGHSILGAVVVASQLGLEPGVAGQAYLIPYGDTCTLVPGWQGLVGLLNNSGRATAWTGAVFEGDYFEYEQGAYPKLVHRPGENSGDETKLQWVYACGRVNGSENPVIEAWPINRVWKHRDKFNKVGRRHYSFQHPEMYARKVVLLQVLKYMPRSIEINNAITAADAAEMGRTTRVEEGIVIDMDMPGGAQELPAGNVGRSITEQRQAEQQKPADAPPEPEPEKPATSSGPSATDLLNDILARGKKRNMSKSVLQDRLREHGWIKADIAIDGLPAGEYANILDGWQEFEDQLEGKA